MTANIRNLQSKRLIILPGWGGSRETWAEFVALARPYFLSVEVIELPCFGDEPCPETVWGVEKYAEFVAARIATLPPGEKILLGHSFGGAVAAQLAATGPARISHLILAGAAIYRPKQRLRRAIFGVLAKCGKVLFRLPVLEKGSVFARRLLYRTADSPDYQHTSGIKREIFQKIVRQDRAHLLPQIHIPTTVIHGTIDSYVPYACAKSMAAAIPQATLVTMPHGTHGLHLKTPQAFLTAILESISSESL